MIKSVRSKDGLGQLRIVVISVTTLVLGTAVNLSANADVGSESCAAVAPFSRFQPNMNEASTLLPKAKGDQGLSHVLSGHIPQMIRKMADLGKLAEEQVLPVTVSLSLNNETELDNRIAEMYRVGSPTYHQFLTSQDFNSRYAPTAEQVASEKAFLESQGLVVQDVSANRVLIHVQGTVGALNKAFKTELHQFRHVSGKTYFAPAFDLQAPLGSQINAVIGLSNTSHYGTHLKINKSHAGSKDGTQPEGSAPGGGLAPADITKAYSIPSSADGTGQTLALFELDGYDASDITAYSQQFNLPNVKLTNVLVDGAPGTGGDDGAVEVTLDIEMMVALAPHASQIVVYEGPNSSQGVVDTYSKIASDNLAPQISTSWGEPEGNNDSATLKSENTAFKQMVAQGQSLYAAAGDSGAEDDGQTVSVDDPASQPYVIGVGGTKVIIGSDSSYQSETTWNEITNQEGAGGGGISTLWAIPSWQKGAFTSANTQASSSKRNVPDVSLNADPVTSYSIYVQGGLNLVGGTSAAAPLWAAFNALVNQQRAAKGLSGLGFANPAIYAVASGQNYGADFNDIADGSGNGDPTIGSFTAVKGFDNATGWGSFKGTGLLQDLATDSSKTNSSNSCAL